MCVCVYIFFQILLLFFLILTKINRYKPHKIASVCYIHFVENVTETSVCKYEWPHFVL